MVGQDDSLIGILGVALGIAHGAAHNAALHVPAVTVGVSAGVAGRCPQEGHVNLQFPGLNGAGTPAVAADHHGHIHQSSGDGVRQLSPQAGGLDPADDTVLNMADQRGVAVRKRRGRQHQIVEAHLRQLVHNHVDNIVAVAEMVVEGDHHAVLESGAADRLFQRGNDLIAGILPLLDGGIALVQLRILEFLLQVLQFLPEGDLIQKITHAVLPPQTVCPRLWPDPVSAGPAGQWDGPPSSRSGR